MKKNKYYESVFKAYYKQLYFYALRYVHIPEDAADITNDVFCHFWEKCKQWDTNVSPLPYLYTLTRNFCVNYWRKKEIEQKTLHTIELTDLYSHSISEVIMQEKKIEQIMNNINLLPPQTHKVFNECFLKGRTYKEVAEEFQISVNTIKTHIKRALALLREKNNR